MKSTFIPVPQDENLRLEASVTKTATFNGTTLNIDGGNFAPGGIGEPMAGVVNVSAIRQTITIAGTFHAGDVITTTVNGHAVAYTAISGDTDFAGVATSIAAAINADATAANMLAVPAAAVGAQINLTPKVALTVSTAVTGSSNTITATVGSETYTFKMQDSDDGSNWFDAGPSQAADHVGAFSVGGIVSRTNARLLLTIAGTAPSITYEAWLNPYCE